MSFPNSEHNLGSPAGNGYILSSTIAGIRSWIQQTFSNIVGSISDAQHGNRSGGTLHQDTDGIIAGFMPVSDKLKLDLLTIPLAVALNGGGTINLASFTFTIPATGTAALKNIDNQFTVAQGIRGSASGQAAGLYVPSVSGDALPAGIFGSASGTSEALRGVTTSSYGVRGIATTGNGVSGEATNGNALTGVVTTGLALHALKSDVASATATEIMRLSRAAASGTPGSGFGAKVAWWLYSSTSANRLASEERIVWSTATDASRSSQIERWLSKNAVFIEAVRFDTLDSATQSNAMLMHNGILKRVLVDSVTGALSVAP